MRERERERCEDSGWLLAAPWRPHSPTNQIYISRKRNLRLEVQMKHRTYPDSGLRQVGPHGYLLPGWHVRVSVPSKQSLQLLELLGGEVSSLSPLSLLLAVLVQAVVVTVRHLTALAGGLAGVWNRKLCENLLPISILQCEVTCPIVTCVVSSVMANTVRHNGYWYGRLWHNAA